MSGRSPSIAPRSRPDPDRPPVENWMIMPGQCFFSPSCRRANRSGSEVGVWSSFRTWQCTIEAPASKDSWADSTCSSTVIGTAGLFSLRGSEPVIATQMMQGLAVIGGSVQMSRKTVSPSPCRRMSKR